MDQGLHKQLDKLIVERHQAGWKQAHIAAAMGVSRKCVKTWIDRYAAEGEAGLVTRSSVPHSMPTKTSPEVEHRVLAARAQYRDGPDVLGPKVALHRRQWSQGRHLSDPARWRSGGSGW